MKIQRYSCVLKKSGVLHVADGCSPIHTVDHALIAARKELADSPSERILCFHTDGANNLIGFEQVSQGGLHGAAVMPREILRGAIIANASAIILAHNHPSGDPTPSVEDINMTKSIASACKVVGLSFLDHIIITRSSRYSSLTAMGHIEI